MSHDYVICVITDFVINIIISIAQACCFHGAGQEAGVELCHLIALAAHVPAGKTGKTGVAVLESGAGRLAATACLVPAHAGQSLGYFRTQSASLHCLLAPTVAAEQREQHCWE